MQNIRVLFQYFQLVHGLFASIPSTRCNKTQSFDWASLYQVSLDNMAEAVGFEPTDPSLDHSISSRGRYDHFDTLPKPFYYTPADRKSQANPESLA